MKTKFLFFFIIALAIQTKAQTTPWIAHGATWYYTWWSGAGGITGNDKIEYVNDTIIQGKNCQELRLTSYQYGLTGPGSPLTLIYTQTSTYGFTYSSGDTVFYLVDSAFKVLYNFAAVAGDKWNLGIDTNVFLCSKSILLVDSTSTKMIGGNPHRMIYVTDSTHSSVGLQGQLTRTPIIEHIGSMNYLFPNPRNCNSSIAVDFNFYTLSCFSDSLEMYSLPGVDCENPYHVGINELTSNKDEIQSYPNPADDELYIRISREDNLEIKITDVLGNKIMEQSSGSKHLLRMDMANLQSGLYFISFENKQGEKTIQKFIKK